MDVPCAGILSLGKAVILDRGPYLKMDKQRPP